MKADEMIGRRFGKLTVEEDSGRRSGHSILWRCRCDCAGEILATRRQLESGAVRDCGCAAKAPRPQVTDLLGQRFGKLTVEGDSGRRTGKGVIFWLCRCDCGGSVQATRAQLVSGSVTNCGCVPKAHAAGNRAEDLTGRQFGELTVIRRAEENKNGRACWLCRCSCGKEHIVSSLKLKSGHTRSCGCKRYQGSGNRLDLTGRRFGRLTALYFVRKAGRVKDSYWHCRCDCGKELDVHTMSLLRGATLSCGCFNREQAAGFHDHLHYRDDTCLERLLRVREEPARNKAGFRGLYLTENRKYRAMIGFQKKHYVLGTFDSFEEAVQARLEAEEALHTAYVNALMRYELYAKANPVWAEQNPFYFTVSRVGASFETQTPPLPKESGLNRTEKRER